ncbi:hypothetical protein FCM35_KLT06477 [Carex littledalei]|uniref:Pectinesterase inhibitor domain-containing protein n=1 Tax=Carex littledalei TaxID=544730 RepID=A0A833QTV7_9POAL|nr:hypothetical protein FCM35_KLT06477 [Carex littledalei]
MSANLTGLLNITLNLAIKNTTTIISHVKYLLSNSTYAHLKNGLSCCQENYTIAKDNLSEAVNQITNNPSNKYNIDNATYAIYKARAMSVYCWNYCDLDNKSLYNPFLAKEDCNAKQLYHMALMFLDKDTFST